jgi:hypothetical protein
MSFAAQHPGRDRRKPAFHRRPEPDRAGRRVPDITQGKLHDWKTADFAEVLDTGMTPDSDRIGGAMVEVVANTRQLSAADRQAIAVYLKSLSAAK